MPTDSVARLCERVKELKKALGGLPWTDDHVEATVKLIRVAPRLAKMVELAKNFVATRPTMNQGGVSAALLLRGLDRMAAAALAEIDDG